MKEIGGYLELGCNRGSIYHDEAIALNSGRACLEYLIRIKGIQKIWIPRFLCDSVAQRCEKLGIEVSRYNINRNFTISFPEMKSGEWLYIVNYYGQLGKEIIGDIQSTWSNLICDNAQSYFEKPMEGVATLYTCRKYFGVPDGGFLYTGSVQGEETTINLEIDSSGTRMSHLTGRVEDGAQKHYGEYQENEKRFIDMPLMYMSDITRNLLRVLDYGFIKKSRESNWDCLDRLLGKFNGINIRKSMAPYAYPFYYPEGERIREALIAQKIFVPVLWPDVLRECETQSVEYDLARNILPLPCDQRYSEEDMVYMAEAVKKLIV